MPAIRAGSTICLEHSLEALEAIVMIAWQSNWITHQLLADDA